MTSSYVIKWGRLPYLILSVLCLSFLTVASALAKAPPAAPTENVWRENFSRFRAPHIIFDNKEALDNRLRMLDYAPAGSEVAILAFVVENGETVRELAAHVCRAAQRGVDVKWLTDSKSGSLPGEPNPFDHPAMEEIFQYMANCGAEVRIHNYFDEFTKIAGFIKPANKYLFAGDIAQIGVNRLNHRKLFWAKTPAGQACFLLGGRNLGDHYLAWHPGGDSFLDSDIMICNHYQKDPSDLPYADQSEFEQLVHATRASFESLWTDEENGPNGDIEWDAPVKVYRVPANNRFSFEHIYLAKTGSDGLKRDAKEFGFGTNLDSARGKTPEEGEIPVAEDLGVPVPGSRFQLSYDWQLKTSVWNPEYDQIRQSLHDMVRREQAEIFIESAYTEYDLEMQELLKEALARGVRVTVIANSIFTSDGPSKAISLTRAEFTNDVLVRYGDNFEMDFDAYYELPRQRYQDPKQKGRFEFYVSTPYAGHMIHFKGAGFKCQKGDAGNYYKSFIIGSHNFHVRSGLADKEHALIWKEPVDLTCVYRLGEAKAAAAGIDIAEIESRYLVDPATGGFTRLKPEFRDLIEHRLRFWSGLNHQFGAINNKPILLAFPSLRSELDSIQDQMGDEGVTVKSVANKAFHWISDRLLYENYDPAQVPELKSGAKKILNWLSPARDFVSRFL